MKYENYFLFKGKKEGRGKANRTTEMFPMTRGN